MSKDRKDFPILDQIVNDEPLVYLDNAATTMHKPQEVIDAVVAAMSSMGNAGRGANEASLSASRIIYDTREKLCRLFHGTSPKQVVFTANSTESLNIAGERAVEAGRSCDYYDAGT